MFVVDVIVVANVDLCFISRLHSFTHLNCIYAFVAQINFMPLPISFFVCFFLCLQNIAKNIVLVCKTGVLVI